MRVDKFLKVSRLIKRRTVAKEAAEQGRITVNGKVAKPGTEVEIGDRLSITIGERVEEFEILSVDEHVRKEDAVNLYKKL